jgi:hypothetical protein
MSSYTRIAPDDVWKEYVYGVYLYTKKNSEEFVLLRNRDEVFRYINRIYIKDKE